MAQNESPSLFTGIFAGIIDWANEHLVLGSYLFHNDKRVFMKTEIMMLVVVLICIAILVSIQYSPYWLGLAISILLVQRVVEFLVVYSRNFILHKGKIYVQFKDVKTRGQWLIMMFFLNMVQVVLVFAIWYHFLSSHYPEAFNRILGSLDSFYFSAITFLTIGFGDIIPLTAPAKMLVILQGSITFYILVVVINGLIALHFNQQD